MEPLKRILRHSSLIPATQCESHLSQAYYGNKDRGESATQHRRMLAMQPAETISESLDRLYTTHSLAARFKSRLTAVDSHKPTGVLLMVVFRPGFGAIRLSHYTERLLSSAADLQLLRMRYRHICLDSTKSKEPVNLCPQPETVKSSTSLST